MNISSLPYLESYENKQKSSKKAIPISESIESDNGQEANHMRSGKKPNGKALSVTKINIDKSHID